jgi:RNA polymerase sigma factor (sigma-70 family)
MSIIEKNYQDLFGVAKSEATNQLGGSSGEDYASWAEDIAQDTIVRLLEMEAEGTLKEDEVFGLCKLIAFRKATNFYTKEIRRREIEEENGDKINSMLTEQSAELLAADPLEILAYDEMRDRLDDLSPLLYSTTERHYIDGLSVSEIAEQDGVTANVIYQRLHRARNFIESGEDYGETH